ncbi:MAG TPA: hypothetical protein VG796_24960 [Verrucomicrobiales bacterium]|nr:hypothetical protein [Verrucomicrobiales bacterium]
MKAAHRNPFDTPAATMLISDNKSVADARRIIAAWQTTHSDPSPSLT